MHTGHGSKGLFTTEEASDAGDVQAELGMLERWVERHDGKLDGWKCRRYRWVGCLVSATRIDTRGDRQLTSSSKAWWSWNDEIG